MTRGHQPQVMERECGAEQPYVPPRLDEDIGCAARSDVPVLITGGPEDGREIACAIDRRSRSPKGTVEVVDCRQRGAFSRAMSFGHRDRTSSHSHRASILLLQEVHALSLNEQAEIDHRLAEMTSRGDSIRIMASSSAPLFERVCQGAFDERLFYRLNVIHMIVG